MRRLSFLVLFPILWGASLANAQVFEIETSTDGVVTDRTLVQVEEGPVGFSIAAVDGECVSRVARFDNDGRLREWSRINPDQSVDLHLSASAAGDVTVVWQGSQYDVVLDQPFLIADESQYVLFSRWLEQDPSFGERGFVILEPERNRRTRATVRIVGVEEIGVCDRQIGAYRLEMSLASRIARLFWPHVYTYWFSTDDYRFLAAEGTSPGGGDYRSEVIW